MGWFSRNAGATESAQTPAAGDAPDGARTDRDLVIPRVQRLSAEQRAHVDRMLGEVAEAGVDVDDLASIARAYDRWLADWLDVRESKRPDHEVLVQQIAMAVGEHLVRATDLEWSMVTDAFGTDLGVAAAADDFSVVPMNLVAVRWLNRTSGWVPGVVGHLVNLRTTMR